MSQNLGTVDRFIRLVMGLVALGFLAFGPVAADAWGWQQTAAAVVGGIMLLTATVKFCPLYRMLGLKTCRDS